MINCRKCGRPNEDHYRFCLGCGARLDQQKPATTRLDPAAEEQTRSVSLSSLSRPPSNPATPKPPEASSAPAGAEISCWQCGAAIKSGNAFCGKCGSSAEPPADHKPAPKAELVLIRADGSEGHRIHLYPGEQLIGRSDSLFRDDPFISPRHARFVVSASGQLTVHDLDSLNGVFIRLREPAALSHGDQLRVGLELMEFQTPDRLPTLDASRDQTLPLGSPNVPCWGRLSRVVSPTACSHAFLLTRDEVKIGRDRGDIVFNNDAFVSGTHARLYNKGGPHVEDLNSSNGTYIRLQAPRALDHGDMLLVGQQIILVVIPA